MDRHPYRQPLIYSVVGLFAGSIATFLIFNATFQPFRQLGTTPSANSVTTGSNPSSSTVSSGLSQPVVSVSPTMSTPFRVGMMGQSDQHFIVMMIPHHEGAIAMADLALTRAKHAELKQLAQTIKTTQTQEIQQMQTWYKQWYGTEVPKWQPGIGRGIGQGTNTQPGWGYGMGMGHMGRGGGGGCCVGTNLYALENAQDFDKAFIEAMIPHHQMGVMMGQMVLTSTQRPEIRALAESIIQAQTAEINQMQQWYQAWYP